MNAPYLVLKIQEESEILEEITRKRDEFLDVYSLYLNTRLTWVRDEVRLKAYELRILDPNFLFQI